MVNVLAEVEPDGDLLQHVSPDSLEDAPGHCYQCCLLPGDCYQLGRPLPSHVLSYLSQYLTVRGRERGRGGGGRVKNNMEGGTQAPLIIMEKMERDYC